MGRKRKEKGEIERKTEEYKRGKMYMYVHACIGNEGREERREGKRRVYEQGRGGKM